MRVLLPTDFSENAWHAINYAIYLFENTACTFFVIHAHQPSPSALISTINKERDTRLHEITQDEAMIKLHKTVDRLKKINKKSDHSFEAVLESDSLLNAVGRNVVDRDVDFICMGTQGASGLKEIFLGSNTVNIVKNINFCPIIAVPQIYDFDKPDDILFATDYRHFYQKNELEPLIEIASLWEASIRIVHMRVEEQLDKEQERLKKLLSRILGKIPHIDEELAYHPEIAYRINERAHQNSINMVAMINSSHGFFRRLLHEPVIKKIAFKTHVPFLVLPEAL
ncbi:MAG: universal stress protein [Flavobacteriaceae bacterium]